MLSTSLRLLNRPLINLCNDHLISYPTPVNLNYFWNFGSTAGIFLIVQIISGVFLAMHYVSNIGLAFLSLEHIMRNVNNGWFIRYLHSNGASLFFFVVYIHFSRSLFYGSYQKPRGFVWCFGVIIFILIMSTAFIGYVLPWGQMSFWGATVITNLFSAFPFFGDSIVAWLWGGFSVNNATLNRFFSFHYLLPFFIVSFVILHILVLHKNGSSNSLGIKSNVSKIGFYPFFVVKDLFSWFFIFFIYFYFVFFVPNFLGHTDNYIEANSMITPEHIVPEWYFLPFYAILRSVPNKLGGVLMMFSALFILFFLPFLNFSMVRSSFFRPLHKVFFFFIFNKLFYAWLDRWLFSRNTIFRNRSNSYYFLFFLLFIFFTFFKHIR